MVRREGKKVVKQEGRIYEPDCLREVIYLCPSFPSPSDPFPFFAFLVSCHENEKGGCEAKT